MVVRNKQNTNPIVCVCLFAARPLICWFLFLFFKKKKDFVLILIFVMSRAQANFCLAFFMSLVCSFIISFCFLIRVYYSFSVEFLFFKHLEKNVLEKNYWRLFVDFFGLFFIFQHFDKKYYLKKNCPVFKTVHSFWFFMLYIFVCVFKI